MLNKIKEFISQKNVEIQAPVVETQEQKVIIAFEKFINEMRQLDGFPKKALPFLENCLRTLKEVDTETISIQDLATIHKIVARDIPQMVELYLSLPRAHAVSFILENGKTSKDTLIDKLSHQDKQISSIWDEAVVEKTALLVKKQKATTQPPVAKKDFFDM